MIRVALLAAGILLGSCGRGEGPGGAELARALGLPDGVGQVCGDPQILGLEIDDIRGPGACGIEDPVRLYAVGDVTLNPPARIACGTAQALSAWVKEGAQPAARAAGTRVEGLRVAASYACRSRNNRRGARLSEHAKGNAIDISAFRLSNGDTPSVGADWARGPYSKMLRQMHGAACGPFGTTLGPGSDGYHENHVHYDTARYGFGTYCR